MRSHVLALTAALLVTACESTTPTLPAAADAAGGVGFINPLPGAARTQGFGCTYFDREPVAPDCPGGHFHAGVDLALGEGSPVSAAAGGLVTAVRFDRYGYGNYVTVDLGDGLSTLYAHLETAAVAAGALVLQGDPIGLVGTTGNSTGPHLHFEVRSGGRPVDPDLFLPAAHLRGGSP